MRRRRVQLLVAALVLVVILTAVTYPLFVWPATNPPARVDRWWSWRVVMTNDNRTGQEGIRLVRAGVAPVRVISDGGRPGSPKYRCAVSLPASGLSASVRNRPPPMARPSVHRPRRPRGLALAGAGDLHYPRAPGELAAGPVLPRTAVHGGDAASQRQPLRMPVQVPHEWGGLLITLTAHRG